MIRAVFLDIDNTLLSFSGYVRQTMRDGFRQFGLKPYDEAMFGVFERVNGELWRQIERGVLTFDRLLEIRWNRVFEALGIGFDGAVFEAYFRQQLFSSAIPEPHAAELLAYLAPKYTLCAASNGPYEQQLNRLRIAGFDRYFDHFFISERIGVQKPNAGFFEYCLRELRMTDLPGLLPEEIMIVGDSMSSDMALGLRHGAHTCLYLRGQASGHRAEDVDHVVSDLEEIEGIL